MWLRATLWFLGVPTYIGYVVYRYITISRQAVEAAASTTAYRTDDLKHLEFTKLPVHVDWWADVFAPTVFHAVFPLIGIVAFIAFSRVWKEDAERKAAKDALAKS